jgi:uncharacterized protein (DUF3084 family)
MMGSLGSSIASGNTLDECVKLLAVLNDPTQARAALDELIATVAELKSRQAEAAQVETQNTAALAALVQSQTAVNQRSTDLDAGEAALSARSTQNDVAAASIAEREAAVKARELAVADGEAKLAVDTNALTAKIASYRQALGA